MKDWIPQTVVKMPYTTRRGSYSIAFYVRLDPSVVSPGTKSSEKPETIIAVKLLVSQDIQVLFSPIEQKVAAIKIEPEVMNGVWHFLCECSTSCWRVRSLAK